MKSKSKRPQADLSKLALETIAVRAGTRRTEEFHEHSEALFLTSSFCFDSAELAEEGFANADKGFIYSRFTNPTVSMFQDRLASSLANTVMKLASLRRNNLFLATPVLTTSQLLKYWTAILAMHSGLAQKALTPLVYSGHILPAVLTLWRWVLKPS